MKELEPPFLQRGCQTVVEFKPNNYSRTQFPIVQPQLFYTDLWVVKIIVQQYGAASLLPGGGLGTTESAIVAQLQLKDVSMYIALVVAVVIRLENLWFSILVVLVSILLLEDNS